MIKVLITGSNGLVGQKIFQFASDEKGFSMVLTARTELLFDHGSCPFEYFDVTSFEQARDLITRYRPDVVVHTAALSQVDYCETHPEEAERTNYHSVKNLVYLSQCLPFHLVFLSSDFVFRGDRGHYSETDIPFPLTLYGQNKFNAEKYIMNHCPVHTIIRTSLVYGYLPRLSRSNLFVLVKEKLEKNQPLRIVSDQFRTPTLAEDLSAGILNVIKHKRTGIYHLAGKDFLSVYDFSLRIARYFGYDENLITPVSTSTLKEAAQRPAITGLVIDKAGIDLGYHPLGLDDGIRLVAGQMQTS